MRQIVLDALARPRHQPLQDQPPALPFQPLSWQVPHQRHLFYKFVSNNDLCVCDQLRAYFFSNGSSLSFVSLGASLGLRNCWDRDGLDTYGRS